MKQLKFIAILISFSFFIACGSNTEESKKENDKMEIKSNVIDVNKMNRENLKALVEKREKALENGDTPDNARKYDLMKAYVAYGIRFQSYKYADEYLFKGARLCSELGKITESIKYFDKLYSNYPDFKDRPLALFMKAFVLENHAQNLDEAKVVYEQFLSEYPTHEMADDAKISIANLGKTPEQIIREFEVRDSLEKVKAAA